MIFCEHINFGAGNSVREPSTKNRSWNLHTETGRLEQQMLADINKLITNKLITIVTI